MYSERLTFFIDILGFKDIIEESTTNPKLVESLFEALTSVTSENLKLNACGNINHEKIPEEEKDKVLEIMKIYSDTLVKKFDIKATQFSDCLVFSVPVENEIACFTIFEAVAKLMIALHTNFNLLLRGGIAMGQICHIESGPLFGPALVEAYELESKEATYPMILLSNNVAKGILRTQMHEFMLSLFQEKENKLYMSLATAYYYLIYHSTVFNKKQLKKDFFISKDIISKQIDAVDNQRVKEKYKWLYSEMEDMKTKIS
ncbi:hypothetical protein [Sulfurovum sp. NBC37-1]|uniref:hypothetical protein n=1 Tax=Sulfurovum sp. (strain NBC37-1) TaxID=387093 RepID=UPI0001587AD1|nr:hypothetical protein [Sulfurovum sp. NBC37-1]BAF72450.1 conserved hypothetical protein [Sulfurovum sp. NBC37-1]